MSIKPEIISIDEAELHWQRTTLNWKKLTQSQHGLLHDLSIKHYHEGGTSLIIMIPAQEVKIT